MNMLQNFKTALGALVIATLMIAPAYALDLDDAKAQGVIGERATGYLAAVKPASDVDALINDVNAKRKAYYQNIARKNNISLEAVEVRAGQKAISKTATGHYIDSGSGWEKK
ncbi:MAG: hypothetical protein ACJAUG_003678 [Halioglobus sp.]|jgi:uncharacterized protein YdbL (DUF1318 family)